MSELPPDLMRQDPPAADGHAAGELVIRAPVRDRPGKARKRLPSRLPIMLSSMAFLMSLAAVGLAVVTYEQGSRSVRVALAALDQRVSESEGALTRFEGDVGLKLQSFDDLEGDLATLNQRLAQFRDVTTEQGARIGNVEGAVADIETFVKSRSVQVAARKPAPKASRPPPRPAADMALLSVRSVGDIAIVRIGGARGQSPLLQIGDSWQQWEFVSIDGAGAQFKHNGHNVRLAL